MTSSSHLTNGRQLRMYFMALAVPLAMLTLWITYSFGDTLGRPVEQHSAVVLNKQYFEANSSYVSKVVAGRTWVQEAEGSEYWLIECSSGGQNISGIVTRDQFERVNIGDRINIKFRRGRFTGQIAIFEVELDESKGGDHVIPSN